MRIYYIDEIIDDLYEEAILQGAWGCKFSAEDAKMVVFLIDYEGLYYWEAIWGVIRLVNEGVI